MFYFWRRSSDGNVGKEKRLLFVSFWVFVLLFRDFHLRVLNVSQTDIFHSIRKLSYTPAPLS